MKLKNKNVLWMLISGTEKRNWDKARRLYNQNKRTLRTHRQSRSQFKNMFLLLLSFGRYPAMLLKFFFLYKRKGRKRRTKTKKFWHIFPPNFLVSEHLRGSQNVRRELRGECLRQQNGWKALLNTVYIPFKAFIFSRIK